MAWLRVSDSAGNNPIVLAPIVDPTPLPPMDIYMWINALFGLVTRTATNAAGYSRSYVVDDATVATYGGPQWRACAEAAARAGYWTRTADDRGWLLIDDPDHMLHIRTGEEIDWERARKADAANPKLVVPVRLRDGDGCRYCGCVVRWGDSRSRRGGTYDHRIPGRQAQSPDDLRVACRGCNSQRGDDPSADESMPPRPVPAQPLYGPETARFLADRGFTVPVTVQRPGSLSDTALRDPNQDHPSSDDLDGGTPRLGDRAAGATPPTSDRAAGATPLANALLTVDAPCAETADRRATETQSPGRVGHSDRAGSGRSGSGSRRARRGRRKRS